MKCLRTTMITAAAASALLFAPTSASADPSAPFAPLINSTCTFDQIDAALHVSAPDVAAQLDGMPERKAQLQSLFALPIEQRQAAVDQVIAANPDLQAGADQYANSPQAEQAQAVIQQVADTCHNF